MSPLTKIKSNFGHFFEQKSLSLTFGHNLLYERQSSAKTDRKHFDIASVATNQSAQRIDPKSSHSSVVIIVWQKIQFIGGIIGAKIVSIFRIVFTFFQL